MRRVATKTFARMTLVLFFSIFFKLFILSESTKVCNFADDVFFCL